MGVKLSEKLSYTRKKCYDVKVMNLVIVESPTKTKSLSKYLGKDFKVMATMGHMIDLPKSKLGVEIEEKGKKSVFKPDYVVVEGKGAQIKKLKAEAKKAKKIILATDPDREGEAIAWHVEDLLKGKGGEDKFERVVFHAITKSTVLRAMKKPGKLDMALVDAQQARRVLDRLVGYKLSPVLWKKVRRGLSAGRVQSVATRLVVEKEAEIEAFKADEYWDLGVDLKAKKGNSFYAELHRIEGKKVEIKKGKDAKEIEEGLKKAIYEVVNVERKERKVRPRPPFKTSTMQQTAANVLGWSAKKTMSVAQALYEHGKITYHRTDSLHLVSGVVKKITKLVEEKYGKEYVAEGGIFYKSKAKVVAQEAHEAIRPTNVKLMPEMFKGEGRMVNDQKKLYRLIWQKTVASQMAVAVYDATKVLIAAKGKKEMEVLARGEIEKFAGWRKVWERNGGDKEELPEMTEKEKLELVKVKSEQKFTQPPPRFNDASLIRELEKRGIGRPSTYAPTISTIIARNYVERKDRRFYATSIGKAVVEFLMKNFPEQMDYDFTAEMEGNLDDIAEGKLKWQEMLGVFYKPFIKQVKEVEKNSERVKIEVEKTGEKCPDCKKGAIVIREGRFGKFLSCDQFPECKYRANYVVYVEGAKCEDCGSKVVIKKTRKGREFYGCEKYPKCKWASWKKPKVEGEKKEEEEKK